MRKTKLSKLISFLLCLTMVVTSVVQFPVVANATETETPELTILEWDPEAEKGYELEDASTFITEDGETTLKVDGATGDVQWQFYAEEVDTWVSIYGETEETILLKYAKVANMLNEESKTKIRCIDKNGDTVTESDAIDFEVLPAEEGWTFPASGRGETEEIEYTVTDEGSVEINSEDANEGIALAEETPELKEYSVVINYVSENNEIVADPYTATLAAGSNFSATVNFPTVQGYLPYLGNDTESTTSLALNITDIQADQTYTVTYKPTNVDYTVIHYHQKEQHLSSFFH
jgi:hypothetical protein